MNIDDVTTVCVVGAGTMGSQIAQQCALSGYSVILIDADDSQLLRAVRNNRKYLQRRVDKGSMTTVDLEHALDMVRSTTDIHAASEAEFVIEAVVEELETKRHVFRHLERICDPQTVLSTNSSTIGVSQIVPDLVHRGRCVNMHFFHPVLVMRLVEVMRGAETSDSAVELTMALAHHIGKEPVLIQREIYGLLVNRILGAIKREAFWLAEEGFATPQDIDRAVKLGLNHPMGPFELCDFSGIDVFYNAALQRYRETGNDSDRPSPLLEEMVRAGHLGRKTGRGFYEYGESHG